jgi:hypothetical protein
MAEEISPLENHGWWMEQLRKDAKANRPEALRLADELDGIPLADMTEALADDAATELRRLHAVNGELLEALKNLEKEFRKVYPIYYYAEPWGHETNVPLQAARAAIAKAEGEQP